MLSVLKTISKIASAETPREEKGDQDLATAYLASHRSLFQQHDLMDSLLCQLKREDSPKSPRLHRRETWVSARVIELNGILGLGEAEKGENGEGVEQSNFWKLWTKFIYA